MHSMYIVLMMPKSASRVTQLVPEKRGLFPKQRFSKTNRIVLNLHVATERFGDLQRHRSVRIPGGWNRKDLACEQYLMDQEAPTPNSPHTE